MNAEWRSRYDKAIDITRQAGQVALRYFDTALTVERKGDNSPVTVADRETEQALRTALTAAKTPAEQVRVAYLSTLSRLPRDDELATWRAAIQSGGDNALRDLVWVLCNSNEFRFLP